MERIHLQGTKLFGILYSTRHVLPKIAAKYLERDPFHVLGPKIRYMYNHRDLDTLWWSASQGPITKEKRVVRACALKRIRHAFRESLRRKGFDAEGRKVTLDSEGNILSTKPFLKGTMSIMVYPPTVLAPVEELQRDTDTALREMLKFKTRKEKQNGKPTPPRKQKRG